jgi:aryl-alcohol dehydrogenase-like predicted oxidoreductase
MKYRRLGNTGITVSEVGMGTNSIAGQGTYGYVDETQGMATVQRAYELGVTFFDTAEGYSEGRSEEVLGKVLASKLDAVICTKVGARGGVLDAGRVRSAAEGSLRRLRRSSIDVYLLHNPTAEQLRDPALRQALERLRQEGLVRSYGASVLTTAQEEQSHLAMDMGWHSSQNDRRSEGSSRAEVKQQMEGRFTTAEWLGRLAREEGVSRAHAALAWVLSHPEVSSVIPACKTPAQVEDNAAASAITLSSRFLEQARALRNKGQKAS